MNERAARTILLADSEKFNRTGPVTIMPLSDVDGVITDARDQGERGGRIKRG
jgi:DeoR/GlpR family transcriptional regulator of sugar metabolism